MNNQIVLKPHGKLGISNLDNTTIVMGGGYSSVRIDHGNDNRIIGGNGINDIAVNGASNTVIGGDRYDWINAVGPHNTVFGGGGADFIMISGAGSTADGGTGNDHLTVGNGAKVTGGAGADQFWVDPFKLANGGHYGYYQPSGKVSITDLNFKAGDTLHLEMLQNVSPKGFGLESMIVDRNDLIIEIPSVDGRWTIHGAGNAITRDGGVEAAWKAGHVVIDWDYGGGKGIVAPLHTT